MARIIGGIGTSHVPAIGAAMAQGLQQTLAWKPFFDGYAPVRAWLAERRPDAAVVFYNDHGLNFFLDAMPTFAVGAAEHYNHADEGWGLPVSAPFRGDQRLSWRLIDGLVADGFDVTTCQRMLVDHALTIPMDLLWPGERLVPVVPIAINTVQYPLPAPARCLALGRAVGRAIRAWADDVDIVVIGTGGLSHQLDGRRAGFINRPFDLMCLDRLSHDPESLARYSNAELVQEAGAQGVELLMWLAMRGALAEPVHEAHRAYRVPVSNTAAGLLLLEAAAPPG